MIQLIIKNKIKLFLNSIFIFYHKPNIIFKSIDMNNLRNICYILNLDYKDINFILENYLTNKYDNIIIDLTRPDKKIRNNVNEILKI